MSFSQYGSDAVLPSLADIRNQCYWLDDVDAPKDRSRLIGKLTADLVIVGGGFTGLWAAIEVKQNNPTLDVVLVEGDAIAHGASGRNGGFVAASLTHGLANGLSRWPNELARIVKAGQENLDAIEAFINEHQIDCDWLRVGEIDVATEQYQIESLKSFVPTAGTYGEHLVWLDQDQMRAKLNSPTFIGGLFDPDGVAICDPARLAWGLRDAALALGVRIYEHTPVSELDDKGSAIEVKCEFGQVRTPKVLLATNAYPALLRRLKYLIVPVYDSVLVTEPLTTTQKSDIGWNGQEGVSDSGNQFHYYRPTADGRILWGGYDATYHYRSGFGTKFEQSTSSWPKLADHFFATFPQLAGLKFEYGWSGAIDTCTRFSAFWGMALGNKVSYVAGYTGLGVGASRFGARVAVNQLLNFNNPELEFEMTRTLPKPFPPEPLRSASINFTRWSLDQADRHQGKRNWWLRLLDRLGMGFDS
jgi:glycine/D-amino acid oxidase-like deaminating enzyme